MPLLIARRQLLALSSAFLIQTPFSTVQAAPLDGSINLSANTDIQGKHWLTGFTLLDKTVNVQYKLALPGRAHHIAINEKMSVFVVVARRPGNYLIVGDLLSGKMLQELRVPDHRHLLGHGIFSENGQHFYAPESEYQDLQGENGRIVHWQLEENSGAINLVRKDDFPSYGVGPHELLLLSDQRTLVVANGGIRTHPDYGREKLNIATMQPSLVYMDINTGQILAKHQLQEELHQASIRHLAINKSDVVALVMQYEGVPFASIPLVATHKMGETIRLLHIDEEEQRQMQQYVGSVKFDNSGRFIAASCPRGNVITFWDVESGDFIDKVRARDGCGLKGTDHGFLFTAGSTGRISHYDLLTGELTRYELTEFKNDNKVFWDNHLS